MARIFKQITEVIGIIQRGDFAAECSDELQKLIQLLQDEAGPKGKAKGEITIKLILTVQGPSIDIAGDLKVKEPARKPAASVFFVTQDGAISTEHPQQIGMFPSDADSRHSA